MLETKNLSCRYGKNRVLCDISVTFKEGHFTAITGVNGSGKSTLISCLAGVKEYEGNVLLCGKELKKIPVKERAKYVSFLPQSTKAVPFTAWELVSFGRNPYGDLRTDEGKNAVEKSLKTTGLYSLSDRKVNELSGGQKQLCYFSMLLCRNTPYMLLDEPSSGLDAQREEMIYSIAKSLCEKENKTVIAVMHNLSNAARFADDIAVLDEGKCTFFGSKEECAEKRIFESSFGVKRYVCRDGDGERIFYSK